MAATKPIANTAELLERYYLTDHFPHLWCPGCGIGSTSAAFMRAFDRVGLNRDQTVMVNGIGCSGRVGAYLDFDVIKGTHGRSLAFATGVKLWRPELTVVAMMGDGDSSAIGGNHLIHAARRNIQIVTVVFNNQTYGMTGGQYSPTTGEGDAASTAPFGNIERPFDLCKLVAAAGGTFVARGTAYHIRQLTTIFEHALRHHGFAFVEVVSQCPMYYGRYNKMGGPAEMLRWQRDHTITLKQAEKLRPEQMADRFLIGELVNEQRPEYTAEYLKVVERAQAAWAQKEGAR